MPSDGNACSGVNKLRPGPIVTNAAAYEGTKAQYQRKRRRRLLYSHGLYKKDVGGLREAANAFGTVCKEKLVKTLKKARNFDGKIGARRREWASLIGLEEEQNKRSTVKGEDVKRRKVKVER